MNVSSTFGSHTPLRPPVFTVGSALRWLGHDCSNHGSCFAPIDTLRASVWFLGRGPQSRPLPPHTRVLVNATDIGDTVTSIRRLIYQVNGCTSRDAIEVRYEPRCVRSRPDRPFPEQVPVALLPRYRLTRPFTEASLGFDDLRTIPEAPRW